MQAVTHISVYLRTTFAAALLILLGTGCTGMRINPPASAINTHKAPASIPVTVGIVPTEAKLSGGFPDMLPQIKQHLDQSGVFKNVVYPVRADDKLDGTIQLKLNARFDADNTMFPKAFVTGFFMFLPTPLVWYKHEYQAEGTLDLMRGQQKLKTYTARSAVSASHQLFGSAEKMEAQGTEAAAKLLAANIAKALIDDRAFLESVLTTTNTVALR